MRQLTDDMVRLIGEINTTRRARVGFMSTSGPRSPVLWSRFRSGLWELRTAVRCIAESADRAALVCCLETPVANMPEDAGEASRQ